MADLWMKKKKVLTRKERFKITTDAEKCKEDTVERLQSEKEEFYQQLQAEEKEQEALTQQEYDKRMASLSFICQRFRSFHESTVRLERRSRDDSIRSRHPQLKNLNRIVPWINEYVSVWSDRDHRGKQQRLQFVAQIAECIEFLDTLTTCLDDPTDINSLENWHECKQNVRSLLYRNIDAASYNVLTSIEKEMSYLNADIMYYKRENEFFIHTIWTVLDKVRNAKDEKFPLRCSFQDCGVTIHLPKAFAYKAFAVRSLIVLTDWHFTSDCRTAAEFECPQIWRLSLIEHVQNMWAKRLRIREQIEHQRVVMRAEQERRDMIMNKIKHLIPSESSKTGTEAASPASETPNSGITDLNFLNKIIEIKKNFAKEALKEEELEIENIKQYFKVETEKYECNMRKYHIVGGIYHLNVVKQPPQPKLLKDGAMIRMIIGEDSLQMWPYAETYEPQTMVAGHVKQPADNDGEDVENTPENALLAKLILVVIKLPDHVLWFDAPIPVLWDHEKAYWSTEDIHEAKFNEEKQVLAFRAGKMTAFGLAVFKFNNLPFQSWELKRSGGDGTAPEITFVLTTAILALEFVIRADEVTLTMLENANTSALQELVGIPHKPRTLLKLLRTGGVNVFPSADAFQYIDGGQPKHHVTENHLYHCMALLCLSYRFSWSRWNSMSGYKRFVLQVRPTEAEKGLNELLLVTDQQAFITDSADVNQAFAECESTEPGVRAFHPDLWSLFMDRDAERARASLDKVDVVFAETVRFMLSQTKVMSYS